MQNPATGRHQRIPKKTEIQYFLQQIVKWSKILPTKHCPNKSLKIIKHIENPSSLGMAFIGDYLYGYVCRLPMHHYGLHNSGRPPEAAPHAAERRLHIMVNGKATNIAIQVIPDESHPQ